MALTLYRNLYNDHVVSAALKFYENPSDKQNRAALVYELASSPYGGLKSHFAHAVLYDDNPFSKAAESGDAGGVLFDLAAADLDFLQRLAQSCSQSLCLPELAAGVACLEFDFAAKKWGENTDALAHFHRENGRGAFAKYYGFIFEDCLLGVKNLDPIKLSDMVGYELQRGEVVQNTERFLKGLPSNNILLYGDRGTGKSATVKALLNEYAQKGLRIVELSKEHLHKFGELLKLLSDSALKFIIFIDDLTFESADSKYTALKAVLEGSLCARPSNVLIYATSNRRHIVKERHSEREFDDVHRADAIEEALSLSDRFGMTITFVSPNQETYLLIVEKMARLRGLTVPTEELKKKAIQWEMANNGRSPRTAKQFIDFMEGEHKNG